MELVLEVREGFLRPFADSLLLCLDGIRIPVEKDRGQGSRVIGW